MAMFPRILDMKTQMQAEQEAGREREWAGAWRRGYSARNRSGSVNTPDAPVVRAKSSIGGRLNGKSGPAANRRAGGGPIGLEAALYATALQLPCTVFERGRVGENMQRWGCVRLFSPFGMNSTPLGRAPSMPTSRNIRCPTSNAIITGRDHLAAYLEPLALSPALTPLIRENTTVLRIGQRGLLKEDYPGDARRGKEPFRLLVRDDKGKESMEEADVVLDCTGVYGHPRWLGDGGVPALGEIAARQHIAHGLEDISGERRRPMRIKRLWLSVLVTRRRQRCVSWPRLLISTRRHG